MTGTVFAGWVYFAIIFALGFILGVVRVMISAPRLGETTAVLLEVPVILAASWFTARWLVRACSVPAQTRDRLIMGFVAFALTMLAELALSVGLFGRSLPEHFAIYAHGVGLAGLIAQILFALFPVLQLKRR